MMLAYKPIAAFTYTLEKLWRGEHSFAKAFWAYFVLGTLLAQIVAVILAVPFVLLDQRRAAFPVVFAAAVVYPILAGVGAWRSANNYLVRGANVGVSVKVLRALYVLAAKILIIAWLWGIVQRVTGITIGGVLARLGFG